MISFALNCIYYLEPWCKTGVVLHVLLFILLSYQLLHFLLAKFLFSYKTNLMSILLMVKLEIYLFFFNFIAFFHETHVVVKNIRKALILNYKISWWYQFLSNHFLNFIYYLLGTYYVLLSIGLPWMLCKTLSNCKRKRSCHARKIRTRSTTSNCTIFFHVLTLDTEKYTQTLVHITI